MTARRSGAVGPAAAAAVVLLAAVAGLAVAGAGTLDDRVYAIANQLMCPVCAGQTVAESDSAIAREMRDVIRAKLQAGETPAAILNFFVGQFGEGVLAEPPRHGLSLLLYLGPAAGAVGGLAVAVLCIRRWSGRPKGRLGRPEEVAVPHPTDAGVPHAGTEAPGETAAADRVRLARELDARF
jgi:cytochrome c-type biogenesis protein CcmH